MTQLYHDNGAAFGRRTRYFRNAAGGGVEWIYAVDWAGGDRRWYGFGMDGTATIAKLQAGGMFLSRIESGAHRFPAVEAYNADVRACPTYHDGTPRKQWHELGDVERESWIKNPTPREYRSELTPEGEQLVIPGCERKATPKARQLGLWG